MYRFACGSPAPTNGEAMTLPEYAGEVTVVNCTCREGKFNIIFEIRVPGHALVCGSCMNAGRYTREEFVRDKLDWLMPYAEEIA